MSYAINCWAVLVSAVVSMVVGSIWYGPLFGKKYMELMGFNSMSEATKAEMKKNMYLSYIGQFVASLVMFYVLAWLMGATNMMGASGGLMAAFWVWIGFIVPLKFGDALWGGKMVLFWISISSMLVTLLVGGAILGAWQ